MSFIMWMGYVIRDGYVVAKFTIAAEKESTGFVEALIQLLYKWEHVSVQFVFVGNVYEGDTSMWCKGCNLNAFSPN